MTTQSSSSASPIPTRLVSLRNWSLLLGGGMYVGGIFLHLARIHVTGVRVTALGLITLALALRTVEQLRSGTAYARGKPYARDQQPEVYWRIVVVFIVAIGILLWLISALLRGTIAGA